MQLYLAAAPCLSGQRGPLGPAAPVRRLWRGGEPPDITDAARPRAGRAPAADRAGKPRCTAAGHAGPGHPAGVPAPPLYRVRCSRRPQPPGASLFAAGGGCSNGRWRRRTALLVVGACMPYGRGCARRLVVGHGALRGRLCAGGWKRAPGAGARSGSRCALSARG